MSAKDTTLLGEILSVQKAILKALSKKDGEGEGGGNGGGGGGGGGNTAVGGGGAAASATGSFTEVLESLTTLNDTSKKQLEVLERIDKNTAGGGGMGGGGDSAPSKSMGGKKDLGEIGESLVAFSMGIIALVGSIALMALVMPLVPMAMIAAVGIGLIVLGFSKLFEYIGSEETKEKVDRANDNLFGMAKGLGLFVLVVVLASLAIGAVGFGTIAMTALVVIGFAGAFYLLGMGAEKIEDGAKAAGYMGLGMAAIGIGIVVLALSLKFTGDIMGDGGGVLVGALAGFTILAAAALVFYVLGEYKTKVAEGAIAAAMVGLGIAAFGIGLGIYLATISKAMGVGAMATNPPEGVFESIGAMMVGMGLVAVGIMSVVLFGTIVVLLGMLAITGIPEIAVPPGTPEAGSIALALIGLALMVYGFGFDFFMTRVGKWFGMSVKPGGEVEVPSVVGGFFTAQMTANVVPVGILMMGLAVAALGFISPLILQGALSLGAIGLALVSLGYGIKYYVENAGDLEIGDSLKTSLISIRDALFAFVGEEGAAEGGIFDSIGSLISGGAKAGTLMAALLAAMMLGPALSSIAQGLMPWANVTQAPKFTGYDDKGQPIYDKNEVVNILDSTENIATILPKVIQPFIDLSNTANLGQKDSMLSIVTGIQLSESPFSRGVSIAGGIGAVLSSLAQGIGAFNDITQAPKITGYDKMGQPIYDSTTPVNLLLSADNIGTAITAVMKPFIDLANNANLKQEESLLSIYTGINLSESPFARGVSIAGGIGPVLTSLAQGIGSFSDLQNAPKIKGYDKMGQPVFDTEAKPVDLITSAQNVGTAIDAILEPFIDLANNTALKQKTNLLSLLTGIQLGESPFARGISIAGQLGAVLSSMALGIGNFADLKQAKKITGYTKDTGQPIYDEGAVYDIPASIKSLADLLDPNGSNSIVKPFVDLANSADNDKPWSIAGFYTELYAGVRPGTSPLMQGIEMGLQMGLILSSIAGGLGTFANLTAIPTITGTDEKGQPIYGKPVDASGSITNFGTMIGQLVTEFAAAAGSLHPHSNFRNMDGIGAAITGIINGVVSAIDVFSNPEKLKMIESYDENGRPIYSKTEFVSVDTVVENMIYSITRILEAFGTEEMENIMDNIDIDEDEMIGQYLEMFIKPMQGFAKMAGELALGSMSITSLTDEIIYSTVGMVDEFAEISVLGMDSMGTFGELFADFADNVSDVFQDLFDFDVSNTAMYITTENFSGSALIGVSTNLRIGVGAIVDAFVLDHLPTDFTVAEAGAKSVKKILGDIRSFPTFMSGFVQADPVAFGTGAKAAYDGLYTITQVATKGEGKGKTHMTLFTDQISRLAGMATPFERFTKAFGTMAGDMGKFANNFKIMNVDSLNAFKGWTSALVDLSTADPNSFAANVVTTIKAIDAGMGLITGEGGDGQDPVNPPVKPVVPVDGNNPKPAGGLTAQAIQEAFRTALLETVVLTKEYNPSTAGTKGSRIRK